VLLCTGVAEGWELSPILANITFGATLANLSTEANILFKESEEAITPIYIMFFILIGTSLNLSTIGAVLGLSLLYVILRSIGKFGGVWIGGRLTRAEPAVQKNLGLCLWSQAGVTLGLSLVILAEFPPLGAEGLQLATQVVGVITLSTLIVQIIGPSGVKIALKRAGEIGKDTSRTVHEPHAPIPLSKSTLMRE
jgi:Kef-type K+ transport system membrane component KefB